MSTRKIHRRTGGTVAGCALAAFLVACGGPRVVSVRPDASSPSWRPTDVQAVPPRDTPRDHLETRAIRAVESGEATAVARLVEEEGLDLLGLHGWKQYRTPLLSIAVGHGRDAVARFLLERGAAVDAMAVERRDLGSGPEEREVWSPLMIAARACYPEGVALLIEAGADVDRRGAEGVTALMAAAAYDCPEAAEKLIAAGADLEARVGDLSPIREMPVLHAPAGSPRPAMRVSSGPGIMRMSSYSPEKPPGVETLPRGAGATPLWIAAAAGAQRAAEVLNRAGAEPGAAASCADVPEAGPGERACRPARIAALRGHGAIAALIDPGEEFPPRISVRGADLRALDREDLGRKISRIAERGDAAALASYLDAGLDTEAPLPDRGGWSRTPLATAIQARAVPLLRLLLRRGADANNRRSVEEPPGPPGAQQRPRAERTPLMLAAEQGCEECVDLLLSAGADVAAVGSEGWTALAVAVDSGRSAIVRRLIAAGAPLDSRLDPSMTGRFPQVAGATPLWMAAYHGTVDIVRELLAAGADRGALAPCATHRRAKPGERECTVRRIAELQEREGVIALLEGREPVRPGGRPATGRTQPAAPPTAAEILASLENDPDAVREIAAVVNRGDLPVLRALLEGGLDPDVMVCHNGRVPLLSYTVIRGRTAMTSLLIQRGASMEARSLGRRGRDLLMTGFVLGEEIFGARASGCPKSEAPGEDLPVFTPLMYAALAKNMDGLDTLITAGADVNARSPDGLTALMAAAGKNQAWSVRRLLAAGARVDLAIENPESRSEFNAHGATALWLASFNGAADAVQALLEAGADPSAEAQCRSSLASPGESLCTPRRIAALKGNERVIQAIDARTVTPGPPAR